jgi:hypothetical protein
MIKKLGLDYDFAIKRLRVIATRSVGQDVNDVVDPSQVFADTRYERMYLNPDNHCYHCYGTVDDETGALQSVIAIKQEPVRGRWLLQWLGSDSGVENGRALNGVFDLADHAIGVNEAEGMNSWIGCIPAKYESVYDRLWRKHCPAYRQYQVEETLLVPANSVSASSEYFSEMFGSTVQMIDMLVRKHTKREPPKNA